MSTLRLTLLRHGRSRADDENVHEGRYDSPLTHVGVSQAGALAAYWRAHSPGFERLFCSPLSRARQTAQIVGDALNLVPEPRAGWMEFNNAPVAGLAFEEARRRYPAPAFRHRFDPFTRDGGESNAAFHARVILALEEVWNCGADDVLVVAHGGVLNVAPRELLGAPRARFAFGDTGFAQLELGRNSDEVVPRGVNMQPHFSKEFGSGTF